MAHVYFDVSGVAGIGRWTERKDLIVARIRQIGVDRILYGSGGAAGCARSGKSFDARAVRAFGVAGERPPGF